MKTKRNPFLVMAGSCVAAWIVPGHAPQSRAAEAEKSSYEARPAFPRFRTGEYTITDMRKAPGQPDAWYLLMHQGEVRVLPDRPDADASTLFRKVIDYDEKNYLDNIRKSKGPGGTGANASFAAGKAWGMAFHPRYRENGLFYVYRSVPWTDPSVAEAEPEAPKRKRRNDRRPEKPPVPGARPAFPFFCQLVEFRRSAEDPMKGDTGHQRVLFSIPFNDGEHRGCGYTIHEGGGMQFGPDGFLYLGIGDGGEQGDPRGHGQDLGSLRGKILRIDVDGRIGELPYAIPSDNPFVGRKGARPEVWAYGIREPWRISFDRATGDLWCGDVGWMTAEEVNRIVKGGNYGWAIYEGLERKKMDRDLAPDEHRTPLFAHGRVRAKCITGGFVYRGKTCPDLVGKYIHADWLEQDVWALEQAENGAWRPETLFRMKGCAAFAEDTDGEILLVRCSGRIGHFAPSWDPKQDGDPDVVIYRLLPREGEARQQ